MDGVPGEGAPGRGIPTQSLGGENEDSLFANRKLFNSSGIALRLKAEALKADYLGLTSCVALISELLSFLIS